MKKELITGSLLIVLIVGSFINISYLKGFIAGLGNELDLSRTSCEAGDFENAEKVLRSAIDEWTGADGYTHIFIRHSEIDSTTDAFYELLSDVASHDDAAAVGSYEKLRAHLMSLYTMERVSLGSIF